MSLHPNEVLLAPVVSEKSYSLIEDRKYSFSVHKDAHKTQVRQAVEELFGVKVIAVNIDQGPAEAEDARNYARARAPAGRRRSSSSRGDIDRDLRRGAGLDGVRASSSRPAPAAVS